MFQALAALFASLVFAARPDSDTAAPPSSDRALNIIDPRDGAQKVLGQSPVAAHLPAGPSIAIVTTALHPGPSLEQWLDHHLHKGSISKALVYMDNPSEHPAFEKAIGNRSVDLYQGAQVADDMTPESRILVRQEENTKHAIKCLLEQGYEWMLHIDTDELLYELHGTSFWTRLDNVGLVHFANHEAIPLDHDTNDLFSSTLFRINGISNNEFMAYGNGKSAVRLNPGVSPAGPHNFEGFRGKVLKMPADQAVLLHYPTPTFDSWVKKYQHYGDFSGYWFNDRRSPIGLDFMLKSRDLVQQALMSNSWREARAFFKDRCLLDQEARTRAINEGKVRNIDIYGD